ncbi:hypothetical protein [Mangrovimonas xylaniphaga]|uniref:hypothetical protein n=1 Tax=Mangrovimonas xylaniphaga TaxID=1645915 RepID=UPI0021D16740|nr:hypothetical protein [Mangrovimonas xylaniphaga]
MAHSKQDATVFWYLDQTFIGQTETLHEMAILPETGEHLITVMDEFGNQTQRKITISN